MKRFRKLFVLFLSALLCFSSVFPAFASSDSVHNFLITPDDLTGHKDGYDSMALYFYGSTFYSCFFNDADVDVSSYNDSASSYFTLTFEDPVPHQTYVGSVEGFMYGAYGGVADCSGLIVKQFPGSAGNSMRFKKSSVIFTDSPTFRALLLDKGYNCPSQWYLYFDGVNSFDYMCYSLVSTEAGEYVVSFSKSASGFKLNDGVLSASTGYLYSCTFDTLDSAENYLRTGDPSRMVSCTCPKTLQTVDTVYYASFDVRDSSGNLIFAEYPLPDISDPEDETHGLLSGIIGAINNLGKNITNFFNDLINILTFPVKQWLSYYSDVISHFDFIKNIFTFVDLFGDFCERDFSDPVQLEINLGNYSGKYDYGSQAVIMDLEWYTREWPSGLCLKDIGDFIISSFLWLSFLWNLYCAIPDILAGSGMTLRQQVEVKQGITARRQSHLPRLGGKGRRP